MQLSKSITYSNTDVDPLAALAFYNLWKFHTIKLILNQAAVDSNPHLTNCCQNRLTVGFCLQYSKLQYLGTDEI